MNMLCNKQSVIYIASYLMFYERIKYIKIDYYFVQEIVLSKQILPKRELIIYNHVIICYEPY